MDIFARTHTCYTYIRTHSHPFASRGSERVLRRLGVLRHRLDSRMSPPSRDRKPRARGAHHLFTRPFVLLVAFRLVNARVVRTFFNADEFWQGPEIAHKIVYGYGHATWEWSARLRGYAHPLLYAGVYAVGDALGLRSAWFTTNAPRWTHAFVAAAHDAACFRLAKRFHGDACARWAVFLRLVNWFVFFCETRSFSNCVEACLTTWALVYWPLDALGSGVGGARRRRRAVALAALSCAIRPTSAVLWAALGARTLLTARDATWRQKARFAAVDVAPTVSLVFFASACVDRLFYGEWTCVPCNFVRFNVFGGGSAIYGAHPWHWYLTQGYPAVLGTMTPAALSGFWRNRRVAPHAFIVTFWTIVGYSLAAHKEFRFLLPCVSASIVSAASTMSASPPSRRRRVSVAFVVVTNVIAAAYTSVWHQAGTIAVMPYIARLARTMDLTHDGGVLFATPCHQTPFYSHVHADVAMSFLDCSPDVPPGQDASARFAADPARYLSTTYDTIDDASPPSSCPSLPRVVVLFDADARRAADWLTARAYRRTESFHHAHFEVDRELQRRLLVYVRDGDAASS
jgi:phosphatidylinositol glycan class B